MSCPHPEKIGYKTKQGAVAGRASLEKARGIDLGLKPYLCPCGKWHLGHRKKESGWAKRIRKSL